jgi:hypothetical protein
MHALRTSIGIAACLLFSSAAFAEPAYVVSTVNLRTAAGTNNEVVVKIPTGSLIDATNCSEWCEVEWQGKKGFAIASALDRSGRVPPPRRAAAPGPAQARPRAAAIPWANTSLSIRRSPTAHRPSITTAIGRTTGRGAGAADTGERAAL